jgi:hypothetical protein
MSAVAKKELCGITVPPCAWIILSFSCSLRFVGSSLLCSWSLGLARIDGDGGATRLGFKAGVEETMGVVQRRTFEKVYLTCVRSSFQGPSET